MPFQAHEVQTGEVRIWPQQGTPSSHGGGGWLCNGESTPARRGGCVSRARGALTWLRESKRDLTFLEAAEEKGKKGKGNSQDKHILRGSQEK